MALAQLSWLLPICHDTIVHNNCIDDFSRSWVGWHLRCFSCQMYSRAASVMTATKATTAASDLAP